MCLQMKLVAMIRIVNIILIVTVVEAFRIILCRRESSGDHCCWQEYHFTQLLRSLQRRLLDIM